MNTTPAPEALPEQVAEALNCLREAEFKSGMHRSTGKAQAASEAAAHLESTIRAALASRDAELAAEYQRGRIAGKWLAEQLRQGDPVARPLEWEHEGGQWNDKHHGFSIIHDDGDEPEPYAASWGEWDSAQFASLIDAQAWCQGQIQAWVARHVTLAPPPAQPTQALTDEALADCGLLSELAQPPAQPMQAEPVEDPVTVPRGLLGAACAAIERKRDAPKTLAELRRYTVGDLSTTAQAAQPPREPVQPLSDEDIVSAYCAEAHTTQFVSAFRAGAKWAERLITERMSTGETN